MQASQTPVIWTVIICSIILLVSVFYMAGSIESAIEEVEVPSANEVANAVLVGVDVPTATEIADLIEVPETYPSEYSVDKSKEAEAERLVLAEVESNDFREAVFEALENFGVDIDDEDDITRFKVIDVDSEMDGDEDVEVEVDVKVYYFLDGDEDETERALLNTITFEVSELDEDDSFEDAEVAEDYVVTVDKVYEN